MSDAPITLFVPFGEGYGNPGLTLRADSIKELTATIDQLSEQVDEDPESTSVLDHLLDGVLTIKAGVLLKFPQKVQVTAPAANTTNHPQAQSTPADAPNCSHGQMKYREGTTKSGPNAGKQYKGWFCSAPFGTDRAQQCAPQFIR